MSALLTPALRAAGTPRARLGLRDLGIQAAASSLATRQFLKIVAGSPYLLPQQPCSTGARAVVQAERFLRTKSLLPASAACVVNLSRGLAGHSKYHNTKHRKSRQDAAKRILTHQFSRRFSNISERISRESAARWSRSHSRAPDRSFDGRKPGASLARAWVLQAKKAGVPKEVIDKSLKTSKDNANAQSDVYEGAIGSVLVVVEVLTDNRSRTASKIREAFKAASGAMGTAGCASWAFSRKGLLSFEGSGGAAAAEALVEAAIDAGADDVAERAEEELFDAAATTKAADGSFKLDVWTQPDELALVKTKLVEAAYEPVDERLVFKANQPVPLGGEERIKVDAALNDLRDLDDVEEVWHNLLPEDGEREEA